MQPAEKIILYVEDDSDDFFLFDTIVRELNLPPKVIRSENGIAMLEYLAHHENHLPSLIILDVNMPKLDGLSALRALKDSCIYNDIPVVLFTTRITPSVKAASVLYNTTVVEKPYSLSALSSSIISILEKINISQNIVEQ